MKEIRVTLQFVRSEYVRGIRLYLRKSGIAGPKDMFIFFIIFGLSCVLIWLKGMTVINTALIVLLCMAVVMGIFVYLIRPRYQFDHTPQLHDSTAYTFTKEDVGVQNETMAGVFAWAFTKFWNTEEYYYLIQDKQHYTMLPKRVFGGPKELAAFEAMVLEALPDIQCKDYR